MASETIDSAREPTTTPRSILVVDDNLEMRKALVALLEDAGHHVFQAQDGKGAIDYVNEHPVDLLITDLVMPEQEGIGVIRQMVERFPHIPVIAISGMPEYLPVAKALGAAVVLEKPIARTDLLQAVRSLIG